MIDDELGEFQSPSHEPPPFHLHGYPLLYLRVEIEMCSESIQLMIIPNKPKVLFRPHNAEG